MEDFEGNSAPSQTDDSGVTKGTNGDGVESAMTRTEDNVEKVEASSPSVRPGAQRVGGGDQFGKGGRRSAAITSSQGASLSAAVISPPTVLPGATAVSNNSTSNASIRRKEQNASRGLSGGNPRGLRAASEITATEALPDSQSQGARSSNEEATAKAQVVVPGVQSVVGGNQFGKGNARRSTAISSNRMASIELEDASPSPVVPGATAIANNSSDSVTGAIRRKQENANQGPPAGQQRDLPSSSENAPFGTPGALRSAQASESAAAGEPAKKPGAAAVENGPSMEDVVRRKEQRFAEGTIQKPGLRKSEEPPGVQEASSGAARPGAAAVQNNNSLEDYVRLKEQRAMGNMIQKPGLRKGADSSGATTASAGAATGKSGDRAGESAESSRAGATAVDTGSAMEKVIRRKQERASDRNGGGRRGLRRNTDSDAEAPRQDPLSGATPERQAREVAKAQQLAGRAAVVSGAQVVESCEFGPEEIAKEASNANLTDSLPTVREPLETSNANPTDAVVTVQRPREQYQVDPENLVEISPGEDLVQAQIVDEAETIFYATDIQSEKKKRKIRREKNICYLACAVIIIIIAVVISVTQLRPEPATYAPTSTPSQVPSASPSMAPSAAPTTAVRYFLLNMFPDSAEAFLDETTPQYAALEWMKHNHSNEILEVMPEHRVVQRFAMAAFFYSTLGPQWVKSDGWLSSNHECDWFTSLEYQQDVCEDDIIVNLVLVNNRLRGTIPAEVSLLSNLQVFDLEENALTGTLSTYLGLMNNLVELKFSANDVSGSLPTTLGLLENLELLAAASNALSGPLPTTLGMLSNLKELLFDDNSLTGTFPTHLGGMASLEILDVDDNFFTGSLFTELGLLTSLKEFDLDSNSITGTLPTELGLLYDSLEKIDGKNNYLNGTLPTELGLLENLEEFTVNQNFLTGTIPSELGLLENLEEFLLFRNDLVSSVPSEVCQLRSNNLEDFELDCSQISCSCCADNCDVETSPAFESDLALLDCPIGFTPFQVVLVTNENVGDIAWDVTEQRSGSVVLESDGYEDGFSVVGMDHRYCIPDSFDCLIFTVQDVAEYFVYLNGEEIASGEEEGTVELDPSSCMSTEAPTSPP